MSLNFPISPSLGQIYTYLGRSWRWNGSAWDAYNQYNLIRRFAANGSDLYCGTAPITTSSGTSTTDADTIWTIKKITVAADGSITSVLTAQPPGGVNWINYLLHPYS